MKMRGISYVLIGIMVLTLFFGIYAFTYPSMKTILLPAIVSGIVFVLAGIQLCRELKAGTKAQGAIVEQEEDEAKLGGVSDTRNLVINFGWLVGFLAAIYLVGFLVGIALFVFFYLKMHSIGWLKSVALAVVATIFIYVVFVIIAQSNLFPGVLIERYLT